MLEIICGFFSEQGFDTYGIDGSQSACKLAQEICKSKNLSANIQQAYFDNLPFEDESMDIIVDRESTYCGKLEDIKKWWSEANRVLKKGGVVISFKFSDDNPDLLKIKNGLLNAKMLELNTYENFEQGTFEGTGIAHFSSYDELFDIFSFCDIKFINKNIANTIYSTCNNQYNYAEWIVVGVKK